MWLEVLSPYLFGDDQGRDVSGSSPGRGGTAEEKSGGGQAASSPVPSVVVAEHIL